MKMNKILWPLGLIAFSTISCVPKKETKDVDKGPIFYLFYQTIILLSRGEFMEEY